MGAELELAELDRRGAGRERLGVERALEASSPARRAEAEARVEERSSVASGPEMNVVVGGVVSAVDGPGVDSPARRRRSRTRRPRGPASVCVPLVRPVKSDGTGQALNGRAVQRALEGRGGLVAFEGEARRAALARAGRAEDDRRLGRVELDDRPLVGRDRRLGRSPRARRRGPGRCARPSAGRCRSSASRRARSRRASSAHSYWTFAAVGGEVERGAPAVGPRVRARLDRDRRSRRRRPPSGTRPGVGSTLPSASTARTAKSCSPKIRSV